MLNGVASICGGFSGAYLTGYVNPYWCFAIYGLSGIAVMISALSMNKKMEIEGDFEAEEVIDVDPNRSGVRIRRGFFKEVAHNFRIARNTLRVKEF